MNNTIKSQKIPENLTEEDLAKDWTLSSTDLKKILLCRNPFSKLHYAVQLCYLRKYGFFLDPFQVPIRLINHLHFQIGIQTILFPPEETLHENARYQHEASIRTYCGFNFFNADSSKELEVFLINLINEGTDREKLLLLSSEYLFNKKIILPGATILLKIIATALQKAERGMFDEIYDLIPDSFRLKIDELLVVNNCGNSTLESYRKYPKEAKVDHIIEYLDRYDELRTLGATSLDFSQIKSEIIFQFHSLILNYDVYKIKRFSEKKRYSMVACFLSETSRIILDHIVEMNDQYLTSMCRKARHSFEFEHKAVRKKAKQGLDTIIVTVDELLSDEIDESLTIRDWLVRKKKTPLKEAVDALRTLKNIEERGYYEKLRARYSNFRRYFPRFCELPFKAEVGASILLDDLELLRKINKDPSLSDLSKKISEDFLSENQRKSLCDKTGSVPRSYSEIIFALSMKESLRAGQLHLPESRKNVSFWSMIYDHQKWEKDKERFFIELSLPMNSSDIMRKIDIEFETAVNEFSEGLSENKFVSIDEGELKIRKMKEIKDKDDSASDFLETVLPKVRIEDLLLDVHKRSGFLKAFTPLDGLQGRPSEKHEKVLLAAIVAHGTNLGISAMGNSTNGITVDELSHISRWYIREETIKAANAIIVDYHHGLRLSKIWGDGNSSSSDGQRFGVQKSSLLASFYPRYFGHYDRAVTVYTHTSNQHSVFHTDVISCGIREAVYVLDGLLQNSTVLRPSFHFTDTHGYTEHIFALCYLLGFSFMPRIKDLKDQRIYKLDPEKIYSNEIEALFSGKINRALIQEQLEEIIRVVASLKNRITPAHQIVNRLAKALPGDRLAAAITELGRTIKTIFIFKYLTNEELRRKIQRQLNRGEARHQLANHLFFANRGEFRNGNYEEMMSKASCLSLLSNAVLVANTTAIDRIMRTHPVAKTVLMESDLERISPLLFRRIIPNGTYHFRGKN